MTSWVGDHTPIEKQLNEAAGENKPKLHSLVKGMGLVLRVAGRVVEGFSYLIVS